MTTARCRIQRTLAASARPPHAAPHPPQRRTPPHPPTPPLRGDGHRPPGALAADTRPPAPTIAATIARPSPAPRAALAPPSAARSARTARPGRRGQAGPWSRTSTRTAVRDHRTRRRSRRRVHHRVANRCPAPGAAGRAPSTRSARLSRSAAGRPPPSPTARPPAARSTSVLGARDLVPWQRSRSSTSTPIRAASPRSAASPSPPPRASSRRPSEQLGIAADRGQRGAQLVRRIARNRRSRPRSPPPVERSSSRSSIALNAIPSAPPRSAVGARHGASRRPRSPPGVTDPVQRQQAHAHHRQATSPAGPGCR